MDRLASITSNSSSQGGVQDMKSGMQCYSMSDFSKLLVPLINEVMHRLDALEERHRIYPHDAPLKPVDAAKPPEPAKEPTSFLATHNTTNELFVVTMDKELGVNKMYRPTTFGNVITTPNEFTIVRTISPEAKMFMMKGW